MTRNNLPWAGFAAATALAFFASAAPVTAQEESTPKHDTVSIKFAGGSLRQLIDSIGARVPDTNIIVASLADEVVMPSLELRGASVYSALKAIAEVSPSPYMIQVEAQPQGTGNQVFSVQVRKHQSPTMVSQQSDSRTRRSTAVFSLRHLTQTAMDVGENAEGVVLDAKTVLFAIDAALGVETEGSDDKSGEHGAKIRYHEDSRLLIVNARSDQLSLVDDVLKHLSQDIDRARSEAVQAEHTRRATSQNAPRSTGAIGR